MNEFTAHDIAKIERMGLTEDKISMQIYILREGLHPLHLERPCTVGDGILALPKDEVDPFISAQVKAQAEGRYMKFVPASGAATRMFQKWAACLNESYTPDEAARFVNSLPKYAFFPELKTAMSNAGIELDEEMRRRSIRRILEFMIAKGLNYSALPKALIGFHRYEDRSRTAIEEHLVEAALYTRDCNNICRIHFTVSGEHGSIVDSFLNHVRREYENRFGTTYKIELSEQSCSTDTISLDMKNRLVRDSSGELMFRPGGHGALLQNLNSIEGDLVYIKNIDNVVPDRLKEATVFYKRVLGGYLVCFQDRVFSFLQRLSVKSPSEAEIRSADEFCRDELMKNIPDEYLESGKREKALYLSDLLNRPIRVCGMVRNEGEPGGGPFWVRDDRGNSSLQIVEESQIDAGSGEQKEIWNRATHFNPVDLVCGIRDFTGAKFDLNRYVDRNAYFISRKIQNGVEIKALELPGLWNGSMAKWNTVFIEVPIITFNPVKNIEDLLRPQHQPA